MPKVTKLHNKGKPTSIQKVHKAEKADKDDTDPEESLRQFQLELCWCIQQLERSLNEKKGNEKQLQEAWKVLTVLKSNSQPIIRKRQLMRTHFGDYRAKMAAEEKKLAKMASKIKITEATEKPKAKFLRKSAFLSTGDNSFKFNFSLNPDDINTETDTHSNTNNHENNTSAVLNSVSNVNSDVVSDSNKAFKFSFTDTAFKFNFDVNNS